MRTFQKGWLFCFICCLQWGCSRSQQPISIVPLPMLHYTDSTMDRGKQVIYKSEFYLVKNFREDKTTEALIDRFVNYKKDKQFQKYSDYKMIFYKESDQTNLKNILANRRIIDRYSQENDWIYCYKWSNGKFLSRWKIRNGEIIDPKNDIKVENIPDSTLNKN